jgi:hypothetical protein
VFRQNLDIIVVQYSATPNGIMGPGPASLDTVFSNWKFQPAMRAGKPVVLELLVGILPDNIRTGGPP